MKIQLTLILLFISTLSIAQIGGNQLYTSNNSKNYSSKPVIKNTMSSTDSTLTIGASILLNKKADYYVLTLGVSENRKTVIESNQNLNRRIDAFVTDLKKERIEKEDIYVDFVSQIKVYDHRIEDNIILEFFDGFEIRKNVIVRLNDLSIVDEVIELASKQEFYDIIKVEYFNDNVESIYNQLFEDAIEAINKYKSQFVKYSNVKVLDNYRITAANFSTYNPKDMYKQYNEAFETSIVTTRYSSTYTKKDVRKEKTFYYEGVENSKAVDKVIDDISPIIGIQYILDVGIIYELER